jgi:ATP-dependent Clp protease ATP-binding subunit ClpC
MMGGLAVFKHLSEASQRCVVGATNESFYWRHEYLGVEHLFLSLASFEDDVLRNPLCREAFSADALRRVKERMREGSRAPLWAAGPRHTERLRYIMDLSVRIARAFLAEEVQPAHLLLAILVEGESVPCRALRECGVDLDELTRGLKGFVARGGAGAAAQALDPRTPHLNRFGRDLTALARQGKIGPVIGRDGEIHLVAEVLARKTQNNPLLVGPAGTGKTAVVEGFAQRIASGQAPDAFAKCRVVELSLAAVVAGTRYRGDFEERLQGIVREVQSDPNLILFIDEVHTLVGAGAAESATDASNILKPYLARGDLRLVGATSPGEYRRIIMGDAALERRFECIRVEEPSAAETLEILKGLRESYEKHHRVRIEEAALSAAVELAGRYVRRKNFPAKAVDLLDYACARVSLAPKGSVGADGEGARIVDAEAIREALSTRLGVPVGEAREEEARRLLDLEAELKQRIIGQDEAAARVAGVLRASRAGLRPARRPQGVFLFMGPTGVGKTAMARALADLSYGGQLVHLDMSEYHDEFTASRLLGAPPGYVGHGRGGELSNKVHDSPCSVVLFDEVEKAHPSIYNTVFLQIFDEGRVTDTEGLTADFSQTAVVMTSNLGAAEMAAQKRVGFSRSDEASEWRSNALEALKRRFSPELLGRIDEIIVFKPLGPDELVLVAREKLKELKGRLGGRGVSLEIDGAAEALLVEAGQKESGGVRGLFRAIQSHLEAPLAEKLLLGGGLAGRRVRAKVEAGLLVFEVV